MNQPLKKDNVSCCVGTIRMGYCFRIFLFLVQPNGSDCVLSGFGSFWLFEVESMVRESVSLAMLIINRSVAIRILKGEEELEQ